jgi:hypothetical protein
VIRKLAEQPGPAALGFTIKSGWACAVLVSNPAGAPRVVDSCRIDLADPAVPTSKQPYHDGFSTARREGAVLSRLLDSVEQYGRKSVGDLIRRHREAGHDVRAAGIVVGSLIDPATIANEHIRIHALEGRLFRTVVQAAAADHHLECSMWRERDLYAAATDSLKRPEPKLRKLVASLGGSGLAGPWRAEQKSATLAALMAIVSGRR